MKPGFASLLPLLMLGGCVHTLWVKPGATRGDFEQSKAACMLQAAQQVPQNNREELAEAGHKATHAECQDEKHHTDCHEVTTYAPAQYRTVDANEALRTQVYRACMYKTGWAEQQFDDDANPLPGGQPIGFSD